MRFGLRTRHFDNNMACAVIAEVGVNHNGDMKIARQLVDVIASSGAEIIKFQAFNTEKEVSKHALKTDYQTEAEGENQLELCKALELSDTQLLMLKEYSESKGLLFLCTAFDFESVNLLVNTIGIQSIKIPSPEITNIPLLEHIGATGVDCILSTGASTLTEVCSAVDCLRQSGCGELVVLHCVSEYPAPVDQLNLRAMNTMRVALNCPIGFSDHSEGIFGAVTAAALGAVCIEKHITLDRNMEGPDHAASIEPDELQDLVHALRVAHQAKGSPIKAPAPCEEGNRPLIRKSIVLECDVEAGTVLTREMLEMKRPTGGIEPQHLKFIIGRTLNTDLKYDDLLLWEHLK